MISVISVWSINLNYVHVGMIPLPIMPSIWWLRSSSRPGMSKFHGRNPMSFASNLNRYSFGPGNEFGWCFHPLWHTLVKRDAYSQYTYIYILYIDIKHVPNHRPEMVKELVIPMELGIPYMVCFMYFITGISRHNWVLLAKPMLTEYSSIFWAYWWGNSSDWVMLEKF